MFTETGGQGPLLALPSPFSVPSHNAHGLVDQPKEPNDGQGCKFMKADSSASGGVSKRELTFCIVSLDKYKLICLSSFLK